jgi:hypothetical protein
MKERLPQVLSAALQANYRGMQTRSALGDGFDVAKQAANNEAAERSDKSIAKLIAEELANGETPFDRAATAAIRKLRG